MDPTQSRIAHTGLSPGEQKARRPIFNHLVAPLAGGPVTHDQAKQMLDTYRAAVLALATVLEIPRPGYPLPLQLRRSDGHAAICDREGRRWHRAHGWVYEPDREALCDDNRFTLAEALPLAREIAEAPRSSTQRLAALLGITHPEKGGA